MEELQKESGLPIITFCGTLDFAKKGHPELDATAKGLVDTKVPFERLSASECNKRFPQFRLTPDQAAVFQKDGGIVYADNAVKAFWAGFKGDTITHDPVANISLESQGVSVETSSGRRVFAEKIIIASGPWTNQVLSLTGLDKFPLEVTNEQVTYYQAKSEKSNELIGPNHMPTFICHDPPPVGVYGIPQVKGGVPGVKVAQHHAGPTVSESDPSMNRDLGVHDSMMRCTDEFVEQTMPFLSTQETAKTNIRCLYTLTPDRHFAIGPHPQNSRVIVGCGFSGHGFKFAPVVGEMLAHFLMGPGKQRMTDDSQELEELMIRPEFNPLRLSSPLKRRTGA